jgi:hypothetical protein
MVEQNRPQSAGLKWRKRAKGPDVPCWFADPKAVAAGYPIKYVNLALYAGNAVLLKERAERLQSEICCGCRVTKSQAGILMGPSGPYSRTTSGIRRVLSIPR